MPIEDMHKVVNAMAPMRKELEKSIDMMIRANRAQGQFVEKLKQSAAKIVPDQTPPPQPPEQPPKPSGMEHLGQPSAALRMFTIMNATGAYQNVKGAAVDYFAQQASSYNGQESGVRARNMTDSVISLAVAGALIALPVSIPAAVVAGLAGLALGTVTGSISGEAEIRANNDDSFSALVRSKFDEVIKQQNKMLQEGVAIAAAREETVVGDPTFLQFEQRLAEMQDELKAVEGEAFIEKRKESLKADIVSITENQKIMKDAHRKIGEFEAEVENEREGIQKQHREEAYKKIDAEGLDGAEAGRVLMAADVAADNELRNQGLDSAYAKQLASEKQLVADLQAELAVGWEKYGYEMGESFSKGLQNARALRYLRDNPHSKLGEKKQSQTTYASVQSYAEYGLGGWNGQPLCDSSYGLGGWNGQQNRFAFGLPYEPFDNFPELLHQGERVLTASENRAVNHTAAAPTINISGGITVREEADINRIAAELARQLERASMIYAGR